MEILETGTFYITARPIYRGRKLYTNLKALNGITLELRCIGTQGRDEKYPGEYMLEPVNDLGVKLFQEYCMNWIASGDVMRVEEGL